MDIEEIKKEMNSMPDSWYYKEKVTFLFQELEKLQQENERYKKTLQIIERNSAIYEELCRETLKT